MPVRNTVIYINNNNNDDTIIYQQIMIAVLAPKFFGKLPKNTISRNYKTTNKRLLSCAKELGTECLVKSSVTKHYGCKHASQVKFYFNTILRVIS